MSNDKFRGRNIGLLLYPDDKSHMQALETIKTEYEHAYILHDKDCDDDGVLKKAHYHVIVNFKQARWNTALAKELDIKTNYMQQIKNNDAMMEYLIHLNDEDKHQYDVSEIKGTMKQKCIKVINNDGKDECVKVIELIEYIDSNKHYITYRSFAHWCASQGYWDIYMRSASIMNNIIKEHNDMYCKGRMIEVETNVNCEIEYQ